MFQEQRWENLSQTACRKKKQNNPYQIQATQKMPPMYSSDISVFGILHRINISYCESNGKIPNTQRLNWFNFSEISSCLSCFWPRKAFLRTHAQNIAGGLFLCIRWQVEQIIRCYGFHSPQRLFSWTPIHLKITEQSMALKFNRKCKVLCMSCS